jgi:hypothetical protein
MPGAGTTKRENNRATADIFISIVFTNLHIIPLRESPAMVMGLAPSLSFVTTDRHGGFPCRFMPPRRRRKILPPWTIGSVRTQRRLF